MTLTQQLAEERRLVLLKTLDASDSSQLNERILKLTLDRSGIGTGRDMIRLELHWLEEQRLLRLEKLPSGAGEDLWVAKLTVDGEEVARGRRHPGVSRRVD